jgi:hypothetical protein
MALGSTQPLTELSTSNISWGVKANGASDINLMMADLDSRNMLHCTVKH